MTISLCGRDRRFTSVSARLEALVQTDLRQDLVELLAGLLGPQASGHY
jgi:hypothetical protein